MKEHLPISCCMAFSGMTILTSYDIEVQFLNGIMHRVQLFHKFFYENDRRSTRLMHQFFFFFFLVGYVEERLW